MKKFEQNEIYNKKHKNEHTTFIYLFKQPYFSQNFEGICVNINIINLQGILEYYESKRHNLHYLKRIRQ